MKIIIFAYTVINLLLPMNVNAVNTVGLNGAPCQYSTIFDAINASFQDDTIYIEPGTYNELLGNISQSLTFVPAVSGCSAELTTANSFSVIIDGSGGSFDNTGGLVQIILNPGQVMFPTVVTFRHMQLRNAFSENGGVIAVTGGAVLVLDDADVTDGIASANGGNIFVLGATGRRSEVQLINDSRILRGEALVDGGALSLDNSKLIVTNGDIDFNSAMGNGGGVFANNSIITLTSDQAKVINNSAEFGGGIYSQHSTIDAVSALINNNQANDQGGGIYTVATQLTLDQATMDGNSTLFTLPNSGGGALSIGASFSNHSITNITNSTLINNHSAQAGGAIKDRGSLQSQLNITNTLISNNSASIHGGGLSLGPSPTSINNSTITANTANHNGGGIYSLSGQFVTINNSTITANTANHNGGGIYSLSGQFVTINNSQINNNIASLLGGGINCIFCQNLMITDTQINQNTATNGAGLYLQKAHQTTIVDSRININHASENGGGIYSQHSNITISSSEDARLLPCSSNIRYCSELSLNVAEQFGGAIYSESTAIVNQTSILTISATNISKNKATLAGSAIYQTATHLVIPNSIKMTNVLVRDNGDDIVQESTIELHKNNTILSIDSATIAANFGNPLFVDNLKANVTIKNSIIYNNSLGPFIATNATLNKTCNNTQAAALNGQSLGINLGNPLFTILNDKFYHLSINSPSVDACTNGPITDLDGFYRPNTGGMYDQGVYELNGSVSLPEEIFFNGFE